MKEFNTLSKHDKIFWTTESMKRMGGNFVYKLGELIRIADSDNQQKLITTFPEYWTQYSKLAESNMEVWQNEM